MRVVIASDFFEPRYGGVSMHIRHLAKYLSRLGHQVVVLTTAGSSSCIDRYNDGFLVIRLPSPLYDNLMFPNNKLTKGVKDIIGVIDPDIINVHHAFSPLAVTIPNAINDEYVKVLTNHSIPIGYESYKRVWFGVTHLLSTFTVIKKIKDYDKYIAVSNLAAEFIGRFVRKPVFVVPNAVDLEEFRIDGSKKDFGLEEDDKLFIMVGRATLKKGYDFGLYVFKQILMVYPNSYLFIAGPEGAVKDYINMLAKILGVSDKVKVLGFIKREELIKLYKAADVFLHFPWGGESFGIVLLEAMASGTPIVATSGDGLKYIIEKSKAGFVIESGDVRKAVEAILKILRGGEEIEEIIMCGKKFASRFSWDKVAKVVERIYISALEE